MSLSLEENMAADLVAFENLFLGLADKTRLRLLGLMASGPVSVGHLVSETGESQPKISRHLAYLRNAGLVDTSRDGKWIYYGLADLDNVRAGSVFRCVIDELSGNQRPLRAKRSPTTRSEREILQESQSLVHEHQNNYAYEEPQMEWEDPDEEAHNELDIFLL